MFNKPFRRDKVDMSSFKKNKNIEIQNRKQIEAAKSKVGQLKNRSRQQSVRTGFQSKKAIHSSIKKVS